MTPEKRQRAFEKLVNYMNSEAQPLSDGSQKTYVVAPELAVTNLLKALEMSATGYLIPKEQMLEVEAPKTNRALLFSFLKGSVFNYLSNENTISEVYAKHRPQLAKALNFLLPEDKKAADNSEPNFFESLLNQNRKSQPYLFKQQGSISKKRPLIDKVDEAKFFHFLISMHEVLTHEKPITRTVINDGISYLEQLTACYEFDHDKMTDLANRHIIVESLLIVFRGNLDAKLVYSVEDFSIDQTWDNIAEVLGKELTDSQKEHILETLPQAQNYKEGVAVRTVIYEMLVKDYVPDEAKVQQLLTSRESRALEAINGVLKLQELTREIRAYGIELGIVSEIERG